MASIDIRRRLDRITLKGLSRPYFNRHLPEQWQEVKDILKDFGITITSEDSCVEFADEEYKVKGVQHALGARDVLVYYNDTLVGKAYLIGSHVTDCEAYFDIDFTTLRSVYSPKSEN